ncbi:response regulator transcription factor [Nostoc sp.]|uniref:response regulator transcription factor n=1 Tax=Nostoc sp. TaxID=1180 RepID=UPI002FFB87BB
MDSNIRILIVDEHTVMRCSLMAFFKYESGMKAIAEACNGIEAVECFRALQPDVTLMDLRMTGLSGVEAITMIRQEFPNAKVIILTAYDGDEDIYRGLRAGAKGYLLKKDTSCNELLEAIRQVHEGKKYIPIGVGAKLADRIEYSTLSERECDVLRLVARGRNNRAIAAALNICEGTVKSHLNQILSKLQADDRTQAVVTALKRGIISI